MMNKVLVVGYPSQYRSSFVSFLNQVDIETDCVSDLVDALEACSFNQDAYGVIVIKAFTLPMGTFDFIKRFRQLNPDFKILLINEGAKERYWSNVDAVVQKSLSFPEILVHIVELMRRNKLRADPLVLTSMIDSIKVSMYQCEVMQYDQPVELTLKEYQILCFFLKNKNQMITRDDLITRVWRKFPEEINVRVVDLHIKNLRQKMHLSALVTRRGEGYYWDE